MINEAAEHKLSEEMYVTRVNYNGKCDRFVKKDVLDKWKCVEVSEGNYNNGCTNEALS